MQPLIPFADGVWLGTEPVHFLGLYLTATMSVLELTDHRLLVYSPVALTPERRAAVDRVGTVAHLYAPNLLHHLWIADWAKAFPAARVHAPEALGKKRPDLRIDRLHGAPPEPAFIDVVDEVRIDGFRLQETVLFHRPSRSLVVADLVHNVRATQHMWTRFYTRVMGFHDRIAVSRALRWMAFFDRRSARRSVDSLLALPFERLVVGHGDPLDAGAREALASAYAWLRMTGA